MDAGAGIYTGLLLFELFSGTSLSMFHFFFMSLGMPEQKELGLSTVPAAAGSYNA